MAYNCSQDSAADVNATRVSVAKACEPTNSTVWTIQQPNGDITMSADITKTARAPISTDRAQRKGTITNVEVAPAHSTDAFLDSLDYWADGFMYSRWDGGLATQRFDVTAVTADGYTLANGVVVPAGAIVYGKNFNNPANNGLKIVQAGSTVTNVAVNGVTAEDDIDSESRLKFVGYNGSFSVDADGNLTGTDFDTWGLVKGQYILIDGFTQDVTSKLARVGNVTPTKITLENSEFVAEETATANIYISKFVRPVSVESPLYYKEQYTVEARYNTVPAIYEYARAVVANQLVINAPLNDKMTLDLSFVAQDLQEPVTTPLPGAGYVNFVESEAYNTVGNLNRVRLTAIDESGLSTYLKDTTITINNNVAGENVLGKEGAAFTNLGALEVTVETEAVMTSGAVLSAIRNNTSINFELAGVNNDGMFVINVPAMSLSDGAKTMNENEKVKVSITGDAYLDENFGFVIGLSLFNYVPGDALQ